MKPEYDSRKNCASPMKRTHNFFSAAHFAIPLPTVNCQLSTVNWTHTFSAKEKDTETGYSYFGSRYYSSDLSIWLSVDPMSAKYPSLSPYVYCANNPIKLVDPNGEDIWEIDESGKLTWKEKNDELDILNATKTGQSMEFPVGTIKEMTPDKGKAKHPADGVFDFVNYIDINDDELAECFFEFAAENTNVEWSHTKYSETGNRIATATNMPYDLADPTGLKITYDFVKKGIKVRESNHSHPFIEGRNINPKPNGEDVSSKCSLIEFCKNHKSSVPTTKVYGKVDGDWKYTTY